MNLESLVKLFRISGKPEIIRGAFEAKIHLNDDVSDLIRSIESPAKFDEIIIGGEEVSNDEVLPGLGDEVVFTLRLPENSENKFYSSFQELIKSTQISRGDIPQDFYLLEEDYYSKTDDGFPNISKLKVICHLIKGLSTLAHYHDEKGSSGYYKLIFIQPDDSESYGGKSIELDTVVKESMFAGSALDISLIESLENNSPDRDPHYGAKTSTFRVTLAEFAQQTPMNQPVFTFLVSEWNDFISLYNKNYDTYLSGFAFHKVKREIAETQIDISEKFSKITSDITGKLFAIPISIASLIPLVKSDSYSDSYFIVTGLGLATLITSGITGNQQNQFKRINCSKDLVLESLEGNLTNIPAELQSAITDMKKELNNNADKLKWILRLFRTMSWVPFLIGTALYLYLYS